VRLAVLLGLLVLVVGCGRIGIDQVTDAQAATDQNVPLDLGGGDAPVCSYSCVLDIGNAMKHL